MRSENLDHQITAPTPTPLKLWPKNKEYDHAADINIRMINTGVFIVMSIAFDDLESRPLLFRSSEYESV